MKTLATTQLFKLSGQLMFQLYALTRRPYWSLEKIQKYQLARIKEMVYQAKNFVPLYAHKNLPDAKDLRSLEDISHLPFLTKQDLLNFPSEQRIHQKYQIKDLIISKSSGSTGQALDVYYDAFSFNLFILAGLRLYLMAFPYRPWHQQTYIYTSPYPLNSLLGLYPLKFISTLNPIEDTIQQLRKSPPDLLVCYPSHLRAIADKMTANDFKIIRPQAINVNSEMSSKSEREYLGRLFQCFVFDDYSSEELTRIASQCKHQNYHLFEDINYIEVIDNQGRPAPEGTLGHIVGTNLHNQGMPLIRYMQGDLGAIRTKKCECGRKFRVLETLTGRKNDSFTLSSGESISSGYLLDLTYSVFLDFPSTVNAFCLIEEKINHWVLELVPGKNWSENLLLQIPQDLKKKLKKDQVTLLGRLVKEVKKTKSGKANPIISLVKRNE